MAGFGEINGGSLGTVMNADNVSFDGTAFGGALTNNGQLLIGSTIAPHIRVGTLTSPLATVSIGYSGPNITLDIAGGSSAIERVNVQTGTTPIIPVGGAITFNGATTAAGTHPVRTDGTGANTVALEVQISQALAASDATKIGLANFSSSYFTVDANGFVTITGTVFSQVVMQVFTSTGTYTPTTGMKYCIIEAIGGGGGGGATTTTAANQVSSGAGGGAGGYARGVFTAATIGASKAVTIGAAGLAGAVAGGTGGTGGTTSVTTLLTASGGTGGTGSGVFTDFVASVAGGAGGVGGGTGAQVIITGSDGEDGFGFFIGFGYSRSGNGGPSVIGGVSRGTTQGGAGGANAGVAGHNYGGGGSGSGLGQSATQQVGGVGTKGIVIVTEFI